MAEIFVVLARRSIFFPSSSACHFFRLVKLTEHDVNAWKHLQLYDHDINCMLLNLECLAKFCRTIFAMNIKKNYYSTRKAM